MAAGSPDGGGARAPDDAAGAIHPFRNPFNRGRAKARQEGATRHGAILPPHTRYGDVMSRPLALVTGASAGIGAAFARHLAAQGYDLALTARRADRLRALADEIAPTGARAIILPVDLSQPGAGAQIAGALAGEDRLEALVNNAGYGLPGGFGDTAWQDQSAFLQVLLTAPLELIHRLAPAMRARGRGRIVNVASLAGLVPGGAGHSLYASVKSAMIRASQSLHLEMAPDGVHVSALCPGLTWSEFHDVNGMREQLNRATPAWLWQSAEAVVSAGWRAVEANRPVCVPGLHNKAIAALARVIPDEAVMGLMKAAPGLRKP